MRSHFTRDLIAALVIVLTVCSIDAAAQQSDAENDFYSLTKETSAAFKNGEHDRAAVLAERLLREAEAWKDNWNYGNAVHAGNLVLGRIALRAGKVDDAKAFLLKAGRTPGSPQLKSFGPDMLFASEMLKRGENKIVLEYFDLCAKFWDKRFSKLADWRAVIEKGETPDFGPNVLYYF